MSETVNRAAPSFEVRLDQRSNIDVARGDDAIERRGDVGEGLERLQPIDVGLGGLDLGGLGVRVAVLFVGGLLRYRRRRAERVPPVGRHLGQGQIRLGLREFALCDGDALVELGRVNDREDVALLDLGADVLAPRADVTAHLAMNGGRLKSFDIAGQHELTRFAAAFHRNHRDWRNGLRLRPLLQLFVILPTPRYSAVTDGDRRHRQDEDRPSSLDRSRLFRIGLGTPGVSRVGWGVFLKALSLRLRASSLRFGLILAHIGEASAGTFGAGSLAWLGCRA